MKPEMQVIESALLKTLTRWRLVAGWRAMWFGLLVGSLCWLTVLALQKLLPVPDSLLDWTGLISLTLLPAGFLVGFFKAPSMIEAARWVDRHSRSKEKLSTALEWSNRGTESDWNEALLREASICARSLNPGKLLPYRLPRSSRWILLCLAAGFGLGFVPEYRSKDFRENQAAAPFIKEAGKELEALTRKTIQETPPLMESTKQALEDLEKLGAELKKVKLNRDQALQKIASAADKIREESRKLNEDPALKKMREVARSRSASNPDGRQSNQNNSSPALNTPGREAGNPEAMESLKQKLDNLLAQAQQMSESGSPLTQNQMNQMMDAMSALTQEALDLGADIDSMEAALAALKSGQVDRFLHELETTAQDMEKLLEMAKQFKEMQAQSQKTGKDLGERLEYGQTSPAASRLMEMAAKNLKNDPGEQESKAMMDELQRALDPAGKYPDEFSNLLKQALAEMKSGRNKDAAQSLKEAADKLRELEQQMQDADSLAKCLNGLQTASMCIGNCQGWSQCESGALKFNQGGKPGSGVGTWADDSLQIDPASLVQQRWDNSGIKQSEMDARGITDRGDGAAPENMLPDRLRGRMNPGGPMPSITLKGVSVKGQSRAEYEDAVISAQDAAQNALNQDEVPKAYRNSVRNYFDDL